MRSSSIAAPFDSEPEEKQERLQTVFERVDSDPEVSEALSLLIGSLDCAMTDRAEIQAWNDFDSRIAYIISRAQRVRP